MSSRRCIENAGCGCQGRLFCPYLSVYVAVFGVTFLFGLLLSFSSHKHTPISWPAEPSKEVWTGEANLERWAVFIISWREGARHRAGLCDRQIPMPEPVSTYKIQSLISLSLAPFAHCSTYGIRWWTHFTHTCYVFFQLLSAGVCVCVGGVRW